MPALPEGQSFLQVAEGNFHTAALTSGGQLLAWGYNDRSQCDVPALPDGQRFLQVAAGFTHTAALTSGGQLLAWGCKLDGRCVVPGLPEGQRWFYGSPIGSSSSQ